MNSTRPTTATAPDKLSSSFFFSLFQTVTLRSGLVACNFSGSVSRRAEL